jgi:hypothetical protein
LVGRHHYRAGDYRERAGQAFAIEVLAMGLYLRNSEVTHQLMVESTERHNKSSCGCYASDERVN